MAFGIQANPFSFNATGQGKTGAAFDPNFSFMGQGDPNRGPEVPYAGQESAGGSGGFGLPSNILSDMISRGAEGINKSQDSALQNAHARAAASGFGVSGDVNRAEDQIMSDYASKRGENERDIRIADALQAQKGFQAANVGGGGGAARPQSTGSSSGVGGGPGGTTMAQWLNSQVTNPAERKQADMEIGLQGFNYAHPSIAGGGTVQADLAKAQTADLNRKNNVQQQPASPSNDGRRFMN